MPRYIDADKLRDKVKTETNPYGKPTLEYESGVKVLAMIDNAPTADVVRVRHGRWIPSEPESDVRFVCSECDTEISTSWDYEADEMWGYCPRCGARMDGERKEQE